MVFFFCIAFFEASENKSTIFERLDPPKVQLDSVSFVRVRAVIPVVIFGVSISFFLA